MYVRRRVAFITIRQGHSVTLQESRNIFVGNMARRSGSARNAPRDMQFNPIGRLIQRLVGLESIDVTVVQFSPGETALLHIEHFATPWQKKPLG
uniref:Uncharacterized protein n=1 Tax=Brassica campestris TaxID=3711 RepID=A0A3P6D8B8_BRACM|nr:unnamed protein product [Brassica rapa]